MATKASNNVFISDFKRFMPLLRNLVSKDFKIKYRRSVLGIAWSILNPLLTMIVLTQVFSLLLRIQMDNFASYYIVGSAIWNFFAEATNASLTSILGAAALIKKVYIPKYVFPLEKCLFSLMNLAFSLVAVLIVVLFQDYTQLSFYTLLFPIPVLYTFVFTLGIALFLGAVTVYFRDIAHLYSVLLTMWIYLTPILYPMAIFDTITSPIAKVVKTVAIYNPMTHFVQFFRDVFMYHTFPDLKENLTCIAISLCTFIVGALIFKKAQKKFILHI